MKKYLFLLFLAPVSLKAANTMTINANGNSAMTINGVAGGGVAFVPNKITAAYTVTSTDTVIVASCTQTAGFTITLPAASSSSGQEIVIDKVDVSTQFVTINAAGADTIGITTDTVTLYAPGASLHIVSDGNGNWLTPWGLPLNVSYVGSINDSNQSGSVGSPNNAICTFYHVPYYCAVSSIDYTVLATSNTGHIDVGIYDINGQKLASSGSQQRLGVVNRQAIALPNVVYLYPGTFALCAAVDNTVATFYRIEGSAVGFTGVYSSSFPLPSTLTFTGGATATANAMKLVAPTIQGLLIDPF